MCLLLTRSPLPIRFERTLLLATAAPRLVPIAYFRFARVPFIARCSMHRVLQLANDVLVPEDSCIVRGLVCTKQRALRGMRAHIERPRVLLLACGIEYQRVEHKFTSLENVISQV